MRKGVVLVLALAAVGARAQGEAGRATEQDRTQRDEGRAGQEARPQQPLPRRQGGAAPTGDQATASAGASGTSDLFERACVDLLHGRAPQDEKAIEALKDACASLMSSKADARIEIEQRQKAQARAAQAQQQRRMALAGGTGSGDANGSVQAGQGAGDVGEGQGVLAAFEQAGSELVNPGSVNSPTGYGRRGPLDYTLITNPVGWFNGLGVNAELFRSFAPKFSWVAGARYSTTDATNGTAQTFGGMAGVDWYVLGRNNEGLRIGPRAEIAAGRENFQGSTTFARLGLGGEVGYNFIASNGITALLAGGLGGRVAGDEQNQDFASFVGGEFGPYAKLGLGYSW